MDDPKDIINQQERPKRAAREQRQEVADAVSDSFLVVVLAGIAFLLASIVLGQMPGLIEQAGSKLESVME